MTDGSRAGSPAVEPPDIDENDIETMEEFKQRLIHWIGQMMFVSGETAEPSAETTWMIEEIVREQVVEMVGLCPLEAFCLTNTWSSSLKPLPSPIVVAPRRFPSLTLSSKFVTTEQKSLDSRLSSPGKTCARMSRTRMTKEAETLVTLLTLMRYATLSPFQIVRTDTLIGCWRCQPFCSSKGSCQQEGPVGSALGGSVLLCRAGS